MEQLTIAERMKRRGVTLEDLVEVTGLSRSGVIKCVGEDRLPQNAILRELFVTALDGPQHKEKK